MGFASATVANSAAATWSRRIGACGCTTGARCGCGGAAAPLQPPASAHPDRSGECAGPAGAPVPRAPADDVAQLRELYLSKPRLAVQRFASLTKKSSFARAFAERIFHAPLPTTWHGEGRVGRRAYRMWRASDVPTSLRLDELLPAERASLGSWMYLGDSRVEAPIQKPVCGPQGRPFRPETTLAAPRLSELLHRPQEDLQRGQDARRMVAYARPAIGSAEQARAEEGNVSPDANLDVPGSSSTCYRYRLWFPPSLERADPSGAPSLGPGGIVDASARDPAPPCGGTHAKDWTSVDFDLCMADEFTFQDAVALLTAHYGSLIAAEDALWSLVGVSRPQRDGLLAANLVGDQWNEWNTDGSILNYSPSVSPTPRREFVLRTMQLVREFEEGLPETFEGLAVRAAIGDRIASGSMDFRIYTSEADDTPAILEDPEGWVVHEFIKPRQCFGVDQQQFASGPDFGDLGSDLGNSCTDDGCDVRVVRDLRDRVAFTFQWRGAVENAEYGIGSNHGALSDTVWFCNVTLDRGSVLFDWFVALATRHLARAVAGDGLAHLQAANIVLRMALAVCAEWGRTLIHETAHNLSLWHCAEPDWWRARPHTVGCVQDGAAWTWKLFVTARLGLPGTWSIVNHDAGFPLGTRNESVVYWRPDLGLDLYTAGVQGVFELTDEVLCKQGARASDNELAAMQTWSDVLLVAGILSRSLVLVLASRALAFAAEELDLGEEHSADLRFTIRHPLQRDETVTYCCLRNRTRDCAADPEEASCWPDNPPSGFRGCCEIVQPRTSDVGPRTIIFPDPPALVDPLPSGPDFVEE